MKTAASIFSWVGASLQTITELIILTLGQTVIRYSYGYRTTSNTPYPDWLWILWFVAIILRIVILIWRQDAVDKGNKVACGICTILFVNLVGGILTLCIPEYELNPKKIYNRNHHDSYQCNTYSSESSENTVSKGTNKDETISLLKTYKGLLDDGVITQEEFDKKKAELLGKI